MRQRLLKYLKRLVIVLVVLGALGVAVFTWFCYWPLEGSVDDLLTLVPEDAEFVLRAEWEDLESTGWVQRNVIDEPLHPMVRREVEKALAQARAQIQDIEGQINANIPVEFLQFGVIDDVVKGEVIISGHWCKGLGPDRGPPSWQELLILTRVSWKTRCVAALKHDFIRDQLGPNLEATPEDDEVYKLTFPYMRVLPELKRAGCGGGFIIPPRNQWYLRRVKDVLAISNSERMIRSVADLSHDMSGPGSFAARPGFDIASQPGRVVAAVNVQPLHSYFQRLFQYYPWLRPLRRFVPPESLEKLSGYLSLRGDDLVAGGAEISYFSSHKNAQEIYGNVYSLAQSPVREGISAVVPAKDTFAVVSLRVDPYYLLMNLTNDLLTRGDRDLWEKNLRDNASRGGKYDSIDEILRDLSSRVSDHAMVAVGRLSSEFDTMEHTELYSSHPSARAVAAVMVRVKEGGDQDELDAYMAEIVPIMGFERDLDRVKYGNFTYSRARLGQTFLDFAHVSPCFVLANDYLILTTNEAYMRLVLDAVADPARASLAADPTFQVTMAAVPERGQVGIYLDAEKLTRIPRDSKDGAGAIGTRGLLWDQRNSWVQVAKDTREEAIRYRKELHKKLGVPRNQLQEEKIDELVEARMSIWETELYRGFEEERRLELETLRRFRGVGLVLGADADTIKAHFSVVFRKGEPWLRWAQ